MKEDSDITSGLVADVGCDEYTAVAAEDAAEDAEEAAEAAAEVAAAAVMSVEVLGDC